MGRLRPGAGIAAAQAPLAAAFHQFAESTATTDKMRRDLPELLLQEGGSGIDSLRRQYSEPLRILIAMVGLILTIACANIASLLLSRASARRREIAVRLSLGAGRWRIVRQLLTESLLLSLAGGALAFLVAIPGIRLIESLLTRGNRNLNLHVSLDWRIFVFTLALAFAAGIAFGLAPALQATKVDVAPALKGIGAATARHRFLGLGRALVVAQIAAVAAIGDRSRIVCADTVESGIDRPGLQSRPRAALQPDGAAGRIQRRRSGPVIRIASNAVCGRSGCAPGDPFRYGAGFGHDVGGRRQHSGDG